MEILISTAKINRMFFFSFPFFFILSHQLYILGRAFAAAAATGELRSAVRSFTFTSSAINGKAIFSYRF